jgi:hypothetical protein
MVADRRRVSLITFFTSVVVRIRDQAFAPVGEELRMISSTISLDRFPGVVISPEADAPRLVRDKVAAANSFVPATIRVPLDPAKEVAANSFVPATTLGHHDRGRVAMASNGGQVIGPAPIDQVLARGKMVAVNNGDRAIGPAPIGQVLARAVIGGPRIIGLIIDLIGMTGTIGGTIGGTTSTTIGTITGTIGRGGTAMIGGVGITVPMTIPIISTTGVGPPGRR